MIATTSASRACTEVDAEAEHRGRQDRAPASPARTHQLEEEHPVRSPPRMAPRIAAAALLQAGGKLGQHASASPSTCASLGRSTSAHFQLARHMALLASARRRSASRPALQLAEARAWRCGNRSCARGAGRALPARHRASAADQGLCRRQLHLRSRHESALIPPDQLAGRPRPLASGVRAARGEPPPLGCVGVRGLSGGREADGKGAGTAWRRRHPRR